MEDFLSAFHHHRRCRRTRCSARASYSLRGGPFSPVTRLQSVAGQNPWRPTPRSRCIRRYITLFLPLHPSTGSGRRGAWRHLQQAALCFLCFSPSMQWNETTRPSPITTAEISDLCFIHRTVSRQKVKTSNNIAYICWKSVSSVCSFLLSVSCLLVPLPC